MSGLHNGSGWGSVYFWPKHKSHESALSFSTLKWAFITLILYYLLVFFIHFNILSILQVHNQYIKHISFSQG